jgi:hypothetical protein
VDVCVGNTDDGLFRGLVAYVSGACGFFCCDCSVLVVGVFVVAVPACVARVEVLVVGVSGCVAKVCVFVVTGALPLGCQFAADE